MKHPILGNVEKVHQTKADEKAEKFVNPAIPRLLVPNCVRFLPFSVLDFLNSLKKTFSSFLHRVKEAVASDRLTVKEQQ
jgi:hypothetical protein